MMRSINGYPSNGILMLPQPDNIIDDGEFFIRAYGSGKPVMLIHGNQGSGYSFASLVPLLASFQLIIPDLPGHGYGPQMPNGFSDNPMLASDYCFHVADRFGVETFAVVGHSLGGMIALDMALADPKRVNGIVFMDSFIRLDERPPELFRICPFPGDSAEVIQKIEDCRDDGPGVHWHNQFDIIHRLSELVCPVLELQGEATPETDEIYQKWLADKRSGMPPGWVNVRIKNAAHFLQFEQPELTAGYVNDFLGAVL